MKFYSCLILFLLIPKYSFSSEEIGYTGRFTKLDGSPVSGPVDMKIELAISNDLNVPVCSKVISSIPLTNGVFHLKLGFEASECGGVNLTQILSSIPSGESLAIRIEDTTNEKVYSYQDVVSTPYSLVSKTISSHGATSGQSLVWDGTKWSPVNAAQGTLKDLEAGAGIAVTSVDADTWSVKISNGGVDTTQVANGAITDQKVSSSAAISWSKIDKTGAAASDLGAASSLNTVTAGTGLLGGGAIGANPTLSVDVGTAADKIVQMGSDGKLPAVDGSKLTGINSSRWEDGVGGIFRSGNVGIGTNTPTVALDVNGTVNASSISISGQNLVSGIQGNVMNTAVIGNSCSNVGALAKDASGNLLVCDDAVSLIADNDCISGSVGVGSMTFDESGNMYVCAN